MSADNRSCMSAVTAVTSGYLCFTSGQFRVLCVHTPGHTWVCLRVKEVRVGLLCVVK
jgi:hypothetical protein